MQPNLARWLSSTFAAMLLQSAAAQTTWTVPNLAVLQPWIAQASPGDTLLLGAWHPPFVLDKGLVLRPLSGRTQIFWLGSSGTQLTIPTGESASLADLDFLPNPTAPSSSPAHPVTVNGTATFEDCSFSHSGGNGAAVTASGGALALQRCAFTTSVASDPLRVQAGICSVTDCNITGSTAVAALNMIRDPTAAVRVSGGVLVCSRCTLTAGTALLHQYGFPVGPVSGIGVSGGQVFLTDSTVRGGDYPSGWPTVPPPWTGAPAIEALGGMVRHARCTLLPGSGQPAGPVSTGNATAEPAQVGIGCSAAWRLGTTVTVTANAGSSGQPFAFAFWTGLQPGTVPAVFEPVWGDPATATLFSVSLPAPAAAVPLPVTIPNNPLLIGSTFWLQALQLAPPGVRISALVGGVLR